MLGFITLVHNMIKGTYIFYEDGKEIFRQSNIITKFGKRFFTNVIAGNVPADTKDIAVGITSTSATVNDTRLGFEFYRIPVSLSSIDIQTSNGTSTYSVVYKATLPQTAAGIVSEVGLYPSQRISANNYDSKFITDFEKQLDWSPLPNSISGNQKIGNVLLSMSSGSGTAQEYISYMGLDISGYSINDTLKLAYYKNDTNLSSIILKFYNGDNNYYSLPITPDSGTGYKITTDIPLSSLFGSSTGSPDKSQINKIGIVVTPTSGNTTVVGFDGLRINDEDTFDPAFGLISRSVLSTPLTKLAGRQVDIEYRLDLGF